MKTFMKRRAAGYALLALVLALLCLPGCSSNPASSPDQNGSSSTTSATSDYLAVIEDEPDTVDFQCTSIYYTIATNVFDRLVEMEAQGDGDALVVPSLAKSWEVSDDGLTYTFHLRDDVNFSNGSPLTSADVLYSFTRLLTYPDSCNRDIVEGIVGAKALEAGKADTLEGFTVLGDHDFSITLEQPFAAFLACLSMPGASIMDKESAEEAGELFGKDSEHTIGTGPFVLKSWKPGQGMVLAANKTCWSGAPNCDGVDMRFITEPEEIRSLFEEGELDVLDLDDVGSSAEFFLHGDVYQDKLYQVPRIGITYLALNETVAPLDDVRVRKALQLSLNRPVLLDAVYAGLGSVENGIFPHGLIGYNPKLPEIPFDLDEAKKLLKEAGYPDGFDLTISVKSSSTQWEMTLVKLAASMWEDLGLDVSVKVINEDDFMSARKSGKLACYTAMWTADFDDPDNFIYTFFGNRENTTFRSLCYQRDDIMKRVRDARAISDPEKRIKEYQDLEQIIVQEDAAWIPLFSRLRTYVMSDRIEGVQSSWNGSIKNRYRDITIKETA